MPRRWRGSTTRPSWLRDERVAAVLCDAPPLPLVAARRAGIPGFLLANFTWADIYAPYARAAGGGRPNAWSPSCASAYRQATAVFRAEPALRMAWLPGQINVGMVANPGRDRRSELHRLLGLLAKERLVYFYVGRYGQDDLDWARLEKLRRQGNPLRRLSPRAGRARSQNLHLVPAADWPGGDLIASTDALVAKAGYGTVCEAMACGTPIIYPPRRGFSEFRALDRSLRAWGGGIPVSARDFSCLQAGPGPRPRLEPRPADPAVPHRRRREGREASGWPLLTGRGDKGPPPADRPAPSVGIAGPPLVSARSSRNDFLQVESDALVEADAWRWAGGHSREVGRPGDAIGRLDHSHVSFAGDEEERGIRIRHELPRPGVVVHQQLADRPAFGERPGGDQPVEVSHVPRVDLPDRHPQRPEHVRLGPVRRAMGDAHQVDAALGAQSASCFASRAASSLGIWAGQFGR